MQFWKQQGFLSGHRDGAGGLKADGYWSLEFCFIFYFPLVFSLTEPRLFSSWFGKLCSSAVVSTTFPF